MSDYSPLKEIVPIALYCICQGADISTAIDQLNTETNEATEPIKTISAGRGVAVYCAVNINEYTGVDGERNLQDANWVVPRALRHQSILDKLATNSSILPLPFGTIFSSLDSMKAELEDKVQDINHFFATTVAKQEWALKGYCQKNRILENMLEQEITRQEASLASLPPGKRYLEERKLQQGVSASYNEWLERERRRIANLLGENVEELVVRTILSKKATGKSADMILNWALLVSKENAAFVEMLQTMREKADTTGVQLEFSGPYPPYSFSPKLASSGRVGGS